jgi:hypothetical protein
MKGSRDHHGGDRVFEDQLLLIVGFEHKGVLIEALDATGKLHTAEQVNRYNAFFFARIIEKAVLYVLRWLVHLEFPGSEKFETAIGAVCIVTQAYQGLIRYTPDPLYSGGHGDIRSF